MSVLHKTMATGLIALTFAGASLATATTADARPRDAFWGGLAAGVVGGALLSEAARPAYPVYPAYPAYRPYPVYRTYYRPDYCHFEWLHDDWGNPYRVKVCQR
ncbi:hypothetical protein ACOJBM_08250 [Rhizobium beringeri]|jgi:hypothetical protein|uniref:Lectin-like protein BA14k n=4 Tax=Rhizobium TaxID=379 RepID=A0A1B1CAH3_RHILE|nr:MULTISPECIES: hypothetical protein [Rhizobium]QJS28852.1 hypothetical protein RLTA1_16705 [Rhizobium leguminosarum bv. trifolii TA1]ANP86730.1 hypothetical protein BA011_13985 [Rhizobium leguminosarum]AUW43832.1 conserved exported protein of unknown function [Rhizobium leguminosarum]MBB4439243.1 hypothetical protein [Rhizobium esperanzae]MBC2805090.1 hypothetical protein [Rhizobium ruizarguesonis]